MSAKPNLFLVDISFGGRTAKDFSEAATANKDAVSLICTSPSGNSVQNV